MLIDYLYVHLFSPQIFIADNQFDAAFNSKKALVITFFINRSSFIRVYFVVLNISFGKFLNLLK